MINIPLLKPGLLYYHVLGAPQSLIPAMTSNTTDISNSGATVSAGGAFNNQYDAWQCMGQRLSSINVTTNATGYITYQFPGNVIVNGLYVVSSFNYGGTFTFQASNDDVAWHNLGNTPYILNASINDTFVNNIAYSYYQFSLTPSLVNGIYYEGIREIQLYGYHI